MKIAEQSMLLKLAGVLLLDLDTINSLQPVFSGIKPTVSNIGSYINRLMPSLEFHSRLELITITIVFTQFEDREDLHLVSLLIQNSTDFRFHSLTRDTSLLLLVTAPLTSWLNLLNVLPFDPLEPVAMRVLAILQSAGLQALLLKLYTSGKLTRQP